LNHLLVAGVPVKEGAMPSRPESLVLITAVLFLAFVAHAEARELVYVANVDGFVSVFDAATNQPLASITLPNPDPDSPYGPGQEPGQEGAVAIAPSGTFAYVLQYNRLFVIDTVRNSVTAEILVNGTRLVFSADGAFAYVAGCNSGGICVINTATQAIAAVIPLQPPAASPGGPAWDVAISPDGRTAYVTGAEQLVAIDTSTNMVKGGQLLAGGANAIAITSDGKFLYVTHPGSPGRVLVIEGDGLSVIATVTVPRDPVDIAVTQDGRFAYVTNRFGSPLGGDLSAYVSVIDTSSNTLTASVPLGVGRLSAFGIALTTDGSRAYVTDIDDTTLLVIDTATQAVSADLRIPSDGPTYVAVADVPSSASPPATPSDPVPQSSAGGGTGGACAIAPNGGTTLGTLVCIFLLPAALFRIPSLRG
jgi:YVTN family beta-propeller protein